MPHRHLVQPEASAPAGAGGLALPRPTSLDPSKYASTAFLDRAVEAAETDRDRSAMTTAYNRCDAPQLFREPKHSAAVTALTNSLSVRSGPREKLLPGMESFCSCSAPVGCRPHLFGRYTENKSMVKLCWDMVVSSENPSSLPGIVAFLARIFDEVCSCDIREQAVLHTISSGCGRHNWDCPCHCRLLSDSYTVHSC